MITISFEYNPLKSASNKIKHGIDFEEAKQLWDGRERLEIPAKVTNEERFMVIGSINDLTWTAIITYRNSNIRIISVRRASIKEINIYES